MAKFTDSLKGFVNKHFTGEVTCANCGKTGKVMFFSTLEDGNQICSGCKHEIPAEFGFKPKESTLEEFKELYAYMQHSKNELEPIFNPDDDYSYGCFEVDPKNYLCRVNYGFVFEISNISLYNFIFKAEEFKDGIFNPKVKGDVVMTTLLLEKPFARFDETIIKSNAKGKADKAAFSRTVTYENPKAMDEFLIKFDSLWSKFQAEKEEAALNALVEAKARELLAEQAKANENNA